MIKYIARYDYGSSDSDGKFQMTGEIIVPNEVCSCEVAADLIEYIKLMCVIKKGKSFTLKQNWLYNICEYRESFFGKNYILSKRKKFQTNIDEKIENYISELPIGIHHTKQLIANPNKVNINEYRQLKRYNYNHTKLIRENLVITYVISEVYSAQIYNIRNKLLNNTQLLNTLTGQIKDSFYGEYGHSRFGFTKDEIAYPPLGTKRPLSEFGMTSFPDDFICFCFADILAHYAYEKRKNDVCFDKIEVDWNKKARHDKRYLVEVTFSYKKIIQNNQLGLKKWI